MYVNNFYVVKFYCVSLWQKLVYKVVKPPKDRGVTEEEHFTNKTVAIDELAIFTILFPISIDDNNLS